MSLSEIAGMARARGGGEPVAIVDLAAVDRNVDLLRRWSERTGITWRPAYKTLQSPALLAYVVAKLDRPRVMIHHLRNLDQAMTTLPAGTDFLMGYPPTVGELTQFLRTTPPRGQRPFTLRICVDSPELLAALSALSKASARRLPLEVVLEIDNGGPRGGFTPGAELGQALVTLRSARRRLKLSALLCYDALAAANGNPVYRQTVAEYAQRQLSAAYDQVRAQASDIVDVERLVRNGPGSANYQNWAGSDAANEFSAGSAVLYANFLDQEGHDDAGLAKALYLCAPVLRTPKRLLFGLPGVEIPAGLRPVLVKAGGWPTGNKPTLSKLVHPPGLQDEPFYGRGANSSGMVLAPPGALALGDYVVETAQQVMEAQNYFDTLLATREGRVRATWPTVDRWGG